MRSLPLSTLCLLSLAATGCDGLTFETRTLPDVSSDGSGQSNLNNCGGAGELTFEGAAAEPGERCGRCGSLVCDAAPTGLRCEESASDCTSSIPLGERCTDDTTCISGNCATEPDGRNHDRCAPEGMVFLPRGNFTMGSPESEPNRDPSEAPHLVTLTRDLFMSRTEVTQAEWKTLSGGINPAFFQSPSGTDASTENNNDSGPVEQVDWFAALAFANARSAAESLPGCYTLLGCADNATGWQDGQHTGCTGATLPSGLDCTGYRLPTEAEWEYAARAGSTTAFPWGDALDDTYLWFASNAGGRTQTVGAKQPNSWGLHDMLGNVWEWSWDPYAPYAGDVTDPVGASDGPARAVRGGGFSSGPQFLRSATHDQTTWDIAVKELGFRLARTLPD